MFGFWKGNGTKAIKANALDELIGKAEIIDIREPEEFRRGSVKTAQNVPIGKLLGDPEKYLKADKTYYLLCLSGMRSRRAAKALSKRGYGVISVSGGMQAYTGKNRR